MSLLKAASTSWGRANPDENLASLSNAGMFAGNSESRLANQICKL